MQTFAGNFEHDFEILIPSNENIENSLQISNYVAIPNDWYVVITDVKNSTKAIEAGKYRDINAIGGSTIAALINATKPRKIPYIFGGDGASFCVPPDCISAVKQALRGCQDLAISSSQLFLRIGVVPVHKLTKPVLVNRFQRGENLTQYFFMGGGLDEADHLIKSSGDYEIESNTPIKVDFSGFECRWNEIPSKQEVTFSLIVKSRLPSMQQTLDFYRELTLKIKQFTHEKIQPPLSVEALALSFSSDKLNIEASSKAYSHSALKVWLKKLKIRFENMVGSYWMRFNTEYRGFQWGNYKQDLIDNSDYEKIDDAYRTVLSANRQHSADLVCWLEQQYQQGLIYYGHHETHSALITCLIEQTGTKHIHFVDSTDGGYAMAAKKMKRQIALTSK